MFEFRPPAVVEADAALTRQLRLGDEAAVRELVGRYGGLVQAVALHAAPQEPTDDTEQVVVHTFLQAWRNSEAFEPGDPFAPWLATLARSVAASTGAPVSAAVVDGLLAEPSRWVALSDHVEDRIVASVIAEAHVDPAQIYTAADLEAARAASTTRSSTVRTALLGLVGGLVVLLAAILLLSALGGGSDDDAVTIDLRPTGRVLDATGSIDVERLDAGLWVALQTSPLPDLGDGGSYTALVVLDDGTLLPAGSFTGGDDDIEVDLWAAVREDVGGQFVIAISANGSVGTVLDDSDVIFRAPLP